MKPEQLQAAFKYVAYQQVEGSYFTSQTDKNS